MRRLLLALLAGLALAGPARAACDKSNVCQASDLASCCPGGTSCTIDGVVTIADQPDCTLDFELKNVAVVAGGRIVVGSGNRLAITAGSFRVTRGKLLARGTHGATSGSPGGEIDIQTSGPVVIEQEAEIDVSGGGPATGGGRFLVTAHGSLGIDAATIHADGYETSIAGEIRLAADGPIDMAGNPLEIAAEGGGGGRIAVESEDAVTIGATGRIRANVLDHGPGLGGTLEVSGASLTSSAIMEANGGSGDITLTARAGALIVDRDVLGLSVDSDVDQAGTVTLVTESLGSGVLRADAPISARGLAEEVGGGLVTLDSAATLLFGTDPQKPDTINVSGFGFGTSEVEIRGIGDVELDGDIVGVDEPGTVVTVSSGRTVRIGGTITASGRVGFDAEGGEVDVDAEQDVVIERGAVIDVTAAGFADGGIIDVAAGRHLVVEDADGGQARANLLAESGATGGAGGAIELAAGATDLRGFEQTGDLTFGGLALARAGGATAEGGTVDLQGCQVEVTGVVDAGADTGPTGTTSIVARKSLHLSSDASVKSRVANAVFHLQGTPPVVDPGAAVVPPFSSTEAVACTTAPGVPAVGCLVPCPACGDGNVDAPWEQCEPAPGADHCTAPFCNERCRTDAACDDTDPCQDAFCDPEGGCFRLNKPNGTDCTPPGGSFCTGPQVCQAGICTATSPPPAGCACDEENDVLCPDDDGDPCTVNRTCNGETCVYETLQAPECCHDTGDCEAVQQCSRCDTETNVCELIPNCCLDDADCEDGNPCTENTCDVGQKECNAPEPLNGPQPGCGQLGPNDPKSCFEGTHCAAGVCDPGTPEPCPDDGDPCTEDGTDSNGCCVPELVSESCCSDARPICPGQVDACTTITCNAESQCEEHHLPDCIPCAADADCDPVVPGLCGTSVCRQGRCEPNTPPDCTDGDLMTDDGCVEANGQATCVHTCIDDRPCSDGNACNGVEARVDCRCATVEPAPACTGTEPCTEYGCDPATGCTATVATRVPGVVCWLGEFEAALAGLTRQQIKQGPKKKLGKLAAAVRTKTQASTTARSFKARTKAGKAAATQLNALVKLLGKQRKIPAETLAAMRDALRRAGAEVAAVRAAIVP